MKNHGPCICIHFRTSSSSNKSIIVLFPRSQISKLPLDLYMILSVLIIAFRFILTLVKNFATKISLLYTALVERFTIWVSFVLSDNFTLLPWSPSIACIDSTKNWGKDGLFKRQTSCFTVVGFSKEKPTDAKQFLVDVIIWIVKHLMCKT